MKRPKDTFELLSKLLSEQEAPKSTEKTLLENLFSFVTKDIAEMLEKNPYPQKAKLMGGMRKVLERAEILTRFPELIGRTTIGILGTNGLDQRVLDFVAKSKLPKTNNNIPAILYASDSPNTIQAVNLVENQFKLSETDFLHANRELHKKDIDVRQFLYAYSISASIPNKAITYIHFPYYALRSMEYYQILSNMTDCVLIPTDERGYWIQTMESFAKSNPRTPIHIVTDAKMRDAVEDIVVQFHAKADFLEEPIAIHQLDEAFDHWLTSMNEYRNNVSFAESFLLIFSDLYLYQYQHCGRLTDIVEGMNRDLVKIDHEDTQFSLRKLKQELSESLKTGRNLFQESKTALQRLLEMVHQFEHSLYQASGISDEDWAAETFPYHEEYQEQVAKMILNFLQAGEQAIVSKYMDKLERMKYPFTYILEMYKRVQSNQKPLMKQLELLAKERSHRDLVVAAKIRFGEQLGLAPGHVAQLAEQLPESLGSEEYYAIAMDYEDCGNLEQAKRFYLKALQEGAHRAGNELLRLLDGRRTYELEQLANMLIPEANYRFGLHCLDHNRYAKGITALKIAAVYEHDPAIKKLADIEFLNAVKRKRSSPERAEKAMNIAMELYQYLLQKNPNDTAACENMGTIYYWKEDFRSARSLLEKGKSAESLFLCGKMYQYGNGVAQDLPKAKEYFNQAARLGHQRAKVEYEKVCGWISSNQQRETYSSGRNYSTQSSTSYSGSSRGFCFLTTATCLSLGKEDDCEEIVAFKKYRDEHLIEDADGASLIREYYRIAPEIIRRIEQQADPKKVYQELYDRFISVGYSYLLDNDYVKAKATYIAMVQYLCERYQVKVNS